MRQAFVCIGTADDVIAQLPEMERAPGADVEHIIVERFTIGEARTFRTNATLRPFIRPYRTFVLAFTDATGEAQNALLKTLEEPVGSTQIYVVVPRLDILIPTVRSRLVHFDTTNIDSARSSSGATFLASSYSERLATIAEKVKEKDSVWIEDVLSAVERAATDKKDPALMREIIFVRTHIRAAGASKKMLLEHLALSC